MKTSHLIHAHVWSALFCLTTMTGCNFQDTGLEQSGRCTSHAACEATQICSIEGECVTIASLDMMTDQQVRPVQEDMPADMDAVSPFDLGDVERDAGEDLEQADMAVDATEDMFPSTLPSITQYTLSSDPMEFTAAVSDTQGGFFATGRRFRGTTDAFVTHITGTRITYAMMLKNTQNVDLLAISSRDGQAMAVGHFMRDESRGINGLWVLTDRQNEVSYGRHVNAEESQQAHLNQAVLAMGNEWLIAGTSGSSSEERIFITRVLDNGDIIQARALSRVEEPDARYQVLKLISDGPFVYALIQATDASGNDYESILAQFTAQTLSMNWAYHIHESRNLRLYDIAMDDASIIMVGHVEGEDEGMAIRFNPATPDSASATVYNGIHMTAVKVDTGGIWALGNTSTATREALIYHTKFDNEEVQGLRFPSMSVPTEHASSLLVIDKHMTAITQTNKGVGSIIPLGDKPSALCGAQSFGSSTAITPIAGSITNSPVVFRIRNITIHNRITNEITPELVLLEGSSPSCSK